SPRAWGSRAAPPLFRAAARSIPTCVGLTPVRTPPARPRPVHPHVRGTHERHDPENQATDGPSPRAWGSLLHLHLPLHRTRSIPTCVGLTPQSHRKHGARAVHPHVRGAHTMRAPRNIAVSGPSPRAWGSHPP